MQKAQAFIFPGLDDFGIVAVEALAAGTPVVAYKGGGALDYIIGGTSGQFFEEQTVDSLAETLSNFKPEHYDQVAVRQSAERFSVDAFRTNVRQFVARLGL
ncbi:MAG: putative glycosyltransferase, partial [Candidatus Saccharibacteria bacterium]|nr:putative glycosyltransferase [Candidatus Saccharibacteria bacterium]